MSPRKTPSSKQPRFTALHTRKQSLGGGGSSTHNTLSQGIPIGQDLISAIKRTTVIETYMQTITAQDRKRSKSKKPKASTSILDRELKYEQADLKTSVMFKTAATFDQPYTEEPTIMFKDTVKMQKTDERPVQVQLKENELKTKKHAEIANS